MTRQQRANYSRQLVQPGIPKKWPDIQWYVGNVVGSQVVIEVIGSTQDMVWKGIPQMLRKDTNQIPVLADWVPTPTPTSDGQLVLTYADPLPATCTFELTARSKALGNRFGGLLAPGIASFPDAVLSPVTLVAFLNSSSADSVNVIVTGGVEPYCVNPLLSALNLTTGVPAEAIVLSGSILDIAFPVGSVSPGDSISVITNGIYLVDQFGAKLPDTTVTT